MPAVGPYRPYLAYIADVLPNLVEEGADRTCAILSPREPGSRRSTRRWPDWKSSADMVKAIEPGVRLYEEPPTKGMPSRPTGTTSGSVPPIGRRYARSPDPGTPHNEAREQVREALLSILLDGNDDYEVSPELLHRSLLQNEG